MMREAPHVLHIVNTHIPDDKRQDSIQKIKDIETVLDTCNKRESLASYTTAIIHPDRLREYVSNVNKTMELPGEKIIVVTGGSGTLMHVTSHISSAYPQELSHTSFLYTPTGRDAQSPPPYATTPPHIESLIDTRRQVSLAFPQVTLHGESNRSKWHQTVFSFRSVGMNTQTAREVRGIQAIPSLKEKLQRGEQQSKHWKSTEVSLLYKQPFHPVYDVSIHASYMIQNGNMTPDCVVTIIPPDPMKMKAGIIWDSMAGSNSYLMKKNPWYERKTVTTDTRVWTDPSPYHVDGESQSEGYRFDGVTMLEYKPEGNHRIIFLSHQ